jgi:hypothetical protein
MSQAAQVDVLNGPLALAWSQQWILWRYLVGQADTARLVSRMVEIEIWIYITRRATAVDVKRGVPISVEGELANSKLGSAKFEDIACSQSMLGSLVCADQLPTTDLSIVMDI